MSELHEPNDQIDAGRGWATVIGTLGGIAVIVAMLGVMLYVTRDPAANADTAAREAKLAEAQAADAKAQTEFSWVDQGKGVVRLPVDVAMDRYLAEQKK